MKLFELFEAQEATDYLYHVAFTKNVNRIKAEGLKQFEPSNWDKAANDTRYNEDAGIFAFEHPEDAINWANKTQYEFDTQDVSIVRIKQDEHWDQDPSEDPTLRFGKGRSMRSQRNTSVDDVIDSFDMIDFSNPMKTGLSREEWLTQVADKLRG